MNEAFISCKKENLSFPRFAKYLRWNNFFLSHKEKDPVFQKFLLQKLDLQSFPSFRCDRTLVNMFVQCFENINGGFLIYCVIIFCSITETEKFDNFINCTIYI